MTNSPCNGNVIVVDDQSANLLLLDRFLRPQGYRVRTFTGGLPALDAAELDPPDLFLLDINMPDMNGYDLCRHVKAHPRLSQTPVLFLSGLSDLQDKMLAFRAGGVDYISKPFQLDEVRARVETHIKLYQLQRALQSQNEHLENIVRARTRELTQAHERLAILDRAKTDFVRLISHEFRTPLNGLVGVGELILDQLDNSPDSCELRDVFCQSRERILSILDDALLLSQIDVDGDKFRPTSLPLSSILSRAVEETSELARSRSVGLPLPTSDLGFIVGQEDLLARAFRVLLETAVKFSVAGDTVGVSAPPAPSPDSVWIESSSGVIGQPWLSRFFDVFSVSEAGTAAGNLGLGPPVASRILSLFGGSVSVANRDPRGIRLTVSFAADAVPVRAAAHAN